MLDSHRLARRAYEIRARGDSGGIKDRYVGGVGRANHAAPRQPHPLGGEPGELVDRILDGEQAELADVMPQDPWVGAEAGGVVMAAGGQDGIHLEGVQRVAHRGAQRMLVLVVAAV